MNKNNIEFRLLKQTDIDELHIMLNSLSDEAKNFFHPHKFDKKTLNDLCNSKNDYYYILKLNNEIIGYSMLRFFGYETPSLGCCIKQNFQNKGYGELLTKLTIKKAEEKKIKRIILKVYNNNKSAYELYKKIGFKKIGENQETSEILMEIILKY